MAPPWNFLPADSVHKAKVRPTGWFRKSEIIREPTGFQKEQVHRRKQCSNGPIAPGPIKDRQSYFRRHENEFRGSRQVKTQDEESRSTRMHALPLGVLADVSRGRRCPQITPRDCRSPACDPPWTLSVTTTQCANPSRTCSSLELSGGPLRWFSSQGGRYWILRLWH